MPMPTNAVERLGMNLALATHLIQSGTPMGLVKQQMVPLIAAAKGVLNDEDIDDTEMVRVLTLLPAEVADTLAEGVVMPDDLRDLLDEPEGD